MTALDPIHAACVAMLMFAIGCDANPPPVPIKTWTTDNDTMVVSLLFTHDGCSVYRFYDDWRYHYFAKCPQSATVMSEHGEQRGKTHVEIPETVETR